MTPYMFQFGLPWCVDVLLLDHNTTPGLLSYDINNNSFIIHSFINFHVAKENKNRTLMLQTWKHHLADQLTWFGVSYDNDIILTKGKLFIVLQGFWRIKSFGQIDTPVHWIQLCLSHRSTAASTVSENEGRKAQLSVSTFWKTDSTHTCFEWLCAMHSPNINPRHHSEVEKKKEKNLCFCHC